MIDKTALKANVEKESKLVIVKNVKEVEEEKNINSVISQVDGTKISPIEEIEVSKTKKFLYIFNDIG